MFISLAAFGLIVTLSFTFIIAYVSYYGRLARPSNPAAAKKIGDELKKIKGKTVMMVGAHPDDADWYTGGTLSTLHKNGNKVVVVVATSGEKGGNEDGLAKIREKEQLAAGKILGYDEVVFLRYKDRALEVSNDFVKRLQNLINKHNPSVILTFDTEKEGYIYRHSDHRAAGEATLKALKGYQHIEDIYFFHSAKATVILDISALNDLKNRALEAHKSQRNTRFRRIFRYLPARFFRRPSNDRGAQTYKDIGVEAAELFRKESFK